MNSKDAEGPAFPNPTSEYGTRYLGLMLRDYFAAEAIPRVHWSEIDADTNERAAKACYVIADAMLKARQL